MRCASLRFRKLSTVQEIRNKFRSFGEGTIKTTIIEDICVINMQHIKKRNAFTGKMMAELNDTIEFLETWKEGSFVIIKGAGNTFCSGADLKDAAVNLKTPLLGTEMCKLMQDSLYRLYSLPLISFAVIEGYATGGGAEIAVATDFRLMKEGSLIQFVQAKNGVCTGFGGSSRLVSLVGRQRALMLLAYSKPLSSNDCLELDLIQSVIPKAEEDTETFAVRYINDNFKSNRKALKAIKTLVNSADGLDNNIERLHLQEQHLFSTFWASGTHGEIMSKQNIPKFK